MPTYEYACTKCSEHLEVVQSFTDDALTTCPHCGGPLRKVFGSIGIVLKGSGFYKTDSRSSATGSNGKSGSSEKSGSAEKSGASEGSGASDKSGSSDKAGSSEKTGSSPKSSEKPASSASSAAAS